MSASSPPAAGVSPTIEHGRAYVCFAYDIGQAIDLAAAERRITADKQRSTIRHQRRAPAYFEYTPAPLRVTQPVAPLRVGGGVTDALVDAVLFDFGGVSVRYSIPLHGPLSELRTLSDALYDHPGLLAGSRAVVRQLLEAVAPAISRAALADLVEDYALYHLETLSPRCDPRALLVEQRLRLAQVLRAESVPLSAQEVDDALSCRIGYGAEDLTVIDWNAALVFGPGAEDVLTVLEFANVELLELRFLDDRLDEALDQSYEVLARRFRARFRLAPGRGADLWRIGRLQVDHAMLYEGVNNALKLAGDPYLARVLRLAATRFHLADWDASILRKLQTLDSIYQKLADRAAARRMELLEWIIILLIALSIVLPFVPGASGK